MSAKFHCIKQEEKITAEYGIVLSVSPEISITDCLEAVSSIIGSIHIHSIFKDGSYIKIYLKEKKYLREVIDTGVVIRGKLINVDFLVPPSSKVYLTNVDPVIPDWKLLSLLSPHGTCESTIIHQKISADERFSHIQTSSRVLYMKIHEDQKLPSKLYLVYKGILHEINVRVEGRMKLFKFASCQTL